MLFASLTMMAADLDMLIGDWGRHDSMVRDDMPALVRTQPKNWWRDMFHSTERLLEAARAGKISDLEPRTVAEEALIALAMSRPYAEAADDTAEMLGLTDLVETLPHDGDWDEEYGEVLPQLAGDDDVLMLWDGAMAGVEDPTDPTNRLMGMNDYRADAWHRPLDDA